MMKALKGAVNQAKGFFDNYKAPFLLLFLLVACATTYGQVDTTKTLQRINALGYQYKNIDVDSSFVIPQDTFKLRYADSSGIAIKKGVMYIWTRKKWVAVARKLTDSTVIFNGDTLKISGTGSSGAGSLTNLTATDKTGISWNITNPTTTPNLDLSISVNRMIRDSAVLATPVSNFYSLPVNSTIVVFRALTGNTGVDITTTGGVNSGTTARAGKPFIIANQDSVYKLVLSPYAISDSGTVNDVAPRSWVMIVPIATQWYKVASGNFSQVSYTNANARTAISVTTTGISGAATYDPVTGILNIPNYATGGGSSDSSYVKITTDSIYQNNLININIDDSILVVGTSITGSNGASSTSKGYADILAKKLGYNLYRLSNPGAVLQKPAGYPLTNSFMDTYASTIPVKTSNRKYLVFEFGVNDAWIDYLNPSYNMDTVQFKNDYQTIINYSYTKGWSNSSIIILSPFYQTVSRCPIDTTILYYYATKNFANSNNIKWVDVFNQGRLLGSSGLDDAVHPNDYGHRNAAIKIFTELKDSINLEYNNEVINFNGSSAFKSLYIKTTDTASSNYSLLTIDDINYKVGSTPSEQFVKYYESQPTKINNSNIYVGGIINGNAINSSTRLRVQGSTAPWSSGSGLELYSIGNDGYLFPRNWTTSTTGNLYLNASKVGIGTTVRAGAGAGYTFDAGGNAIANSLSITSTAVNSTGIGSMLLGWSSIGGRISAIDNTGSQLPINILNSITFKIRNLTTNTTLNNTDYTVTVDATSGSKTITLPSAVTFPGIIYVIKKIDSSVNNVIISTTSSQTIDDSTTYILSVQYKYLTVQSDGNNWFVIGNN